MLFRSIKLVFDIRPAGDVLLSVAAKAGLELGFESFEDVVKAKAEVLGADFDEMLGGAAWVGEEFPEQMLVMWTAPLREISVPAADGKLALAPVTRLKIGSAKMVTPPFDTRATRSRARTSPTAYPASPITANSAPDTTKNGATPMLSASAPPIATPAGMAMPIAA